MNKEEKIALIRELIASPQYCIFCGGLVIDKGHTDGRYSVTECTKCGTVFNEE